ncbi:hypothetical protein, conserved [Babesia bigemina]|uniref:Uncharacterized protein n=1 Tax=Babesia bigemina TaxID=5866 RepID=A0A061DC21_BABBI|nr:hypothetical protein, conserved [Babesia bigemina]CDR95290.1 hypothetical protein, conserved [Babesia bigemina]|eukprot:XP_012767476.1 hypothetical protein, conserved [Babesia bigemina]
MIWFCVAVLPALCTAFRIRTAPRATRCSPFALAVSRHDIYRLRRQKEILDAMNFILSRQDKLPIGRHLEPEIVDGMNVIEVALNSDCSHARLKLCITGDSFQQRQGFSWLSKNIKFLRYRLAQLLSHRKNVPTISFEHHNLVQQAGRHGRLGSQNVAEVLMKMNEHVMRRTLRSDSGAADEDKSSGNDSPPPADGRKGFLLV